MNSTAPTAIASHSQDMTKSQAAQELAISMAIFTYAVSDNGAARFLAECRCGWHSASVSEELRDWNIRGHITDWFGRDVLPPTWQWAD